MNALSNSVLASTVARQIAFYNKLNSRKDFVFQREPLTC
ncbi:hypothetical protein LEP1GSC151_0820 [Leptospira interrogans serovar Grippotyphosa str. LT2186]|uniref:Uncharacterized protein n=4 Tax=Leptospira interrogans TaxID=173 RepID=M3GRU1_LEPIR|nr:hypothetical protein LEP1GSC009_0805 [Leptospira interrogans serovar Grippotyphosa str. Andaman]EKR44963.1 hypothetical protein LEP1GSC097_2407 [Leptospira interrogans serovar Grippotyphosa str. UI 08368]EMG09383.1 hypothetical protein LEP1GSC151_0820 [Leptospira interrogans serovar Grippotyphosa str. LT2186]EMJ37456.1 hypothetical protein LEP1GSC079_3365 [Leptospira interrogans str. FPW1039]EMN31940.1 hypothetical protein LEP1GSC083_0404 [Leptospira interrogans serovar Pyrogenes str. L0374]